MSDEGTDVTESTSLPPPTEIEAAKATIERDRDARRLAAKVAIEKVLAEHGAVLVASVLPTPLQDGSIRCVGRVTLDLES